MKKITKKELEELFNYYEELRELNIRVQTILDKVLSKKKNEK